MTSPVESPDAFFDAHGKRERFPPRGVPDTAPAPEPKLEFMDFGGLAGCTPPPRRWIWESWIPQGTVTLLHGYGGTGKTLLAQQICSAYVMGRALFGATMPQGGALMLAGEDDHDELWRRQAAICEAWGIPFTELAGKLHIIPSPDGADITLAEVSDAGNVRALPTLDALQGSIAKAKPGLVALDNAAMLFAAPEIGRRPVTACLGVLHRICREYGCTVLLLSHNNKAGEYSGSTAWENAVRSRLHLRRSEEGETVELHRAKANYARAGDGALTLRWEAGCFRCDDEPALTPGARMEAELKPREDAQVFLAALDTLTAQGRNVSHSTQAKNYAPKIMVGAGLNQGRDKRALAAAMELLFSEGTIEANVPLGKRGSRHKVFGIARTGEGQAEPAPDDAR